MDLTHSYCTAPKLRLTLIGILIMSSVTSGGREFDLRSTCNSIRIGNAKSDLVRLMASKTASPLRYYKRSLLLLLLYVPFLVVPWVLTRILVNRPLGLPSYYNQKGEYGTNIYQRMLFWMRFVNVLDAIASILTVPVISALLAHGAVVYSQRRKAQQAMNLRQSFALADRAWGNVVSLWGAIWNDGTSSPYLWFAAILLGLSKPAICIIH